MAGFLAFGAALFAPSAEEGGVNQDAFPALVAKHAAFCVAEMDPACDAPGREDGVGAETKNFSNHYS